MFGTTKTDSLIKTLLISSFAALSLSACGEKGGETTDATATISAYERAGDHAIGNPNAKVTIVEYASVVCGACANFHNTVYADFKKKYVDSGKVRFVFREFPTPPENFAQAGFLIANCADEDKFFNNIALQFKRQRTILTSPDARQEYENIAKAAGLTEEEFKACVTDEEGIKRYTDVVQTGIDAGVSKTPTFFINGKKVERAPSGPQLFSLETFDEVLAPLLGEDAPAPAETPAEDTPAGEDKSE